MKNTSFHNRMFNCASNFLYATRNLLQQSFIRKKGILSFLPILVCYTLSAQIGGVIQVPSGNYPTLESVFDSLNTYGPSSAGVRFELQAGAIFTPVSPLILTASGNAEGKIVISGSNSKNRPIIQFSGTDVDNEDGIILHGANYVVIEGIEIQNPDGKLETAIRLRNSSTTNGASNNLIQNLSITLNKNNLYQTIAIYIKPDFTPESLEGTTNNNHFINNRIQNTAIGYFFDGNTSTTSLMPIGNEVSGNLENNEISDIVLCGVYIKDQNGFNLLNTKIRNLVRIGGGTTAPAAISTTSGNPTEPLTYPFNIVKNQVDSITSNTTSVFGIYLSARKSTHNIVGNTITNVYATGGWNNSADGIILMGTEINGNIFNNMVSNIAAPASAVSGTPATRGINVRTYSYARIYNNSVLLQYQATATGHNSAALCVFNNTDSVDLRNNIFVNLSTLQDGITGIISAFFKRTPSLSNIVTRSNNNIYYAGVPSSNHLIFYGFNSTNPAIDSTLEQYKLRTQIFDQNSLTENTPFISTTDLHINPDQSTLARENAQPITNFPWLTVDIDNQNRDMQHPDIGADELIFNYPNSVTNMIPANNDTIFIYNRSEITKASFEYYPSPDYILPTKFYVLQTDSVENEIINTTIVPYAPGQNLYEFELADVFEMDCNRFYNWRVIPATDVGETQLTPEEVETIRFYVACVVNIKPTFAEFKVYPNPASNSINIIPGNETLYNVHICDFTGRIVVESVNISGSYTLDISRLIDGIYWMKITNNKQGLWESVFQKFGN